MRKFIVKYKDEDLLTAFRYDTYSTRSAAETSLVYRTNPAVCEILTVEIDESDDNAIVMVVHRGVELDENAKTIPN